MKTSQGFARTSIIIAAFIALLIVALWIYIFRPACFCLDPDAVPPPPPEIVRIINESREWETYRNEEYGFEFKYPAHATVQILGGGDSVYVNLENKDPYVVVSVVKDVNLSDWLVKNRPTSATGSDLVRSEKDITFLGIPAVEQIIFHFDGNGKIIVFEHNKNVYLISYEDSNPNIQDFENFKKISEQIVATFKFIEPVDTTNWKTYKNEEYGFEFRYPLEEDRFKVNKSSFGTYITIGHSIYSSFGLVINNTEEINTQKYLDEVLKNTTPLNAYVQGPKKVIGGREWLSIIPNKSYTPSEDLEEVILNRMSFYTIEDGKIYNMSYKDHYVEGAEVVNSFKFTK